MKNRIKKRRLYACRIAALANTSIKQLKGVLRKRHEPVSIESMRIETMNDMLARFDTKRHGGEVWNNMVPVGREFGAPEIGAKAAPDQDK